MSRFVLTLTTLTCSLLLAGCTLPAAEETAKCHFESASSQERFERAALNKDFSRDACLSQGLAASLRASLGSDASYRAEVVKAYQELARGDRDHEAGGYASLVLKVNSVSAQGARNAGELGLFMESVAATRKAALSCGILDSTDLSLVAQVDSLFVLASLGHHVGMTDPVQGKAVMGALIESAAFAADGKPVQACTEDLGNELEGHLLAWKQFYDGEHPWTGTCKPELTETELRLSCPAS